MANPASAQHTYNSEKELREAALQFFDEGDYQQAVPLYSQLLSLYPKDQEMNFRYGACLIFTDPDKEKPLKYLTFADGQVNAFPEIKYFLGKAYHLNYKFTEAEKYYQQFLDLAKGKTRTKYPCERELEMAAEGKKLTRSFSSLMVVDKKLVSRGDFFRGYDLGDFSGKILVKPEEFQLSQDKKQKDRSLMFLPDNPEKIFFASYGDDGKNGKDIYFVQKLPTGDFSKPQSAGPVLNTPFDEDYPYLSPDGNTLYFCSKGHNSMGGYDVFRSVFDSRTATWGKPENLEFPLNSPGDEMLFITNAAGDMACFASDRSSFNDRIHIYKIRTEKKPMDFALIKGTFLRPENHAGELKVLITISKDGKKAGVFKPDPSDGEYLLNLPGEGSYKFTVEVDGYPTQTGSVEVPSQQELRPLKQEMELVNAGGGPKLVIRNLFDEQIDETVTQAIVAEFVQRESGLEINYDPAQDAVASNNQAGSTGSENASVNANSNNSENQGSVPITNNELVALAYEGVEDLKEEAASLREEAGHAYSFASKKTNLSRELKNQADQLKTEAGNASDPEQVKAMEAQALTRQKESEAVAREALVAFNLAVKIEEEAAKKEEEASRNEQYAKELETAINTKNEKEALKLLERQREQLAGQETNTGGSGGIALTLQTRLGEKEKEAAGYRKKEADQKSEADGIMDEMDKLRSEAAQTKDNEMEEQLLAQVTDLEAERTAIETQRKHFAETASRLEKEISNIRNDIALIKRMEEERDADTQLAMSDTEKDALRNEVNNLDEYLAQSDTEENISINQSGADTTNTGTTAVQTTRSDQTENNNHLAGTTLENGTQSTSTNAIEKLSNDPTAIFDADGTILPYGNFYEEKISQLNSAQKQEEETISIYNDWIQSVNEELAFHQSSTKQLKGREKKVAELQVDSLQTELVALEETVKGLREIADANQVAVTDSDEPDNSLASSSQVPSDTLENTPLTTNENATAANSPDTLNSVGSDFESAGSDNGQQPLTTETNDGLAVNSVDTSASGTDTDGGNSNASTTSESRKGENAQISQNLAESNSIASTTSNVNNENESSLNRTAENQEGTNQLTVDAGRALIAQEELQKIDAQLTDIKEQSDNLRTQALNTEEPAERERLFSEAAKLDKQSWDLRVEKASTLSNVNQAEYLEREVILNKAGANSSAGEDDLAMAELLRDESRHYFEQSRLSSQQAQQMESALDKLNTYEKAARLEKEALVRQERAMKIYTGGSFAPSAVVTATDGGLTETNLPSTNLSSTESNINSISAENEIANANSDSSESSALTTTNHSPALVENTSNQATDNGSREEVVSGETSQTIPNTQETVSSTGSNQNAPVVASPRFTELSNQRMSLVIQADSLERVAALYELEADSLTQLAETAKKKDRERLSAEASDYRVKATAFNDMAFATRDEIYEIDQQLADLKVESAAVTSANESDINSGNGSTSSLPSGMDTEAVRNSSDYKTYADLKRQGVDLMQSAVRDSLRADDYRRTIQANELLIEDLSKQDDPAIEPEIETLSVSNAALRQQADSLSSVSRNNRLEALARDREAEVFLQELDRNSYEQITTAAGSDPQLRTAYDENLSATNSVTSTTGNSNVNPSEVAINTNPEINSNPDNQAGVSGSLSADPGRPISTFTSGGKAVTVPKKLSQDIFVRTPEAVYSESNPIPIDAEMPEGLVFKVQVGAFRNPIPQNLYRSFAPVSGERTGQGLTRYTVGYFPKVGPALLARDVIRGSGYPDAFVVAYLNGKRISYSEAMRMAESGSLPVMATTNNSGSVVGSSNSNANNSPQNTTTNIESNAISVASNATNTDVNFTGGNSSNAEAAAAEIARVKGVFFTVQVGVYSRPVPASQLYYLQPLNKENTDNGYIRYTSGIFSSPEKALEARGVIRGGGLQDAFVSAYVDGERVSVARARELLEQGNMLVQSPAMDRIPGYGRESISQQTTPPATLMENQVSNQPTANNTNPVRVNSEGNTSDPVTPAVVSGVTDEDAGSSLTVTEPGTGKEVQGLIFRVQVGAFREEVPNDMAAKFLRIASKGIDHFTNDDGFTVYVVGNTAAYDVATALKKELGERYELPDAFVVAFLNGEKIETARALEMVAGE